MVVIMMQPLQGWWIFPDGFPRASWNNRAGFFLTDAARGLATLG